MSGKSCVLKGGIDRREATGLYVRKEEKWTDNKQNKSIKQTCTIKSLSS